MDIMDITTRAYGAKLPRARERNARSVAIALENHGEQLGLLAAHRLAQYMAQIAHETGGFQWDREIWGPTAAQKRYEGRADLGNTQKGDGKKFMGRTGIQITGRFNTTAFRDWCRKMFPDLDVPDFVENPELMNTDPWEGLGPIWYWSTRNLNRFADDGNTEMISRRVNGGTNGLADRFDWFVRFALVLLGFEHDDVRGFQEKAGINVDGDAGGQTRRHLHEFLLRLDNPDIEGPDSRSPEVKVDQSNLTYVNQNAIRNRKVTRNLEVKLSEAVEDLWGPYARVEIYSGGQAPKGTGGKRTGSIRHDDNGAGGRAADVYVYDPSNERIVGPELVKLGQYWLAKKNGCVGALMSNGGIHLDEWTKPPRGGGYFWTYKASDKEPWGAVVRPMLERGQAGEMPDLFDWDSLPTGGSTAVTPTTVAVGSGVTLIALGIGAAAEWFTNFFSKFFGG